MRVSELPRDQIEVGESAIHPWPPAGSWAAGQLFRRLTLSMAWTLDGSISPTGAITNASGALLINAPGVISDDARIVIPWPALESWAAQTEISESLFIAAYDGDGALVAGRAFVLPRAPAHDLAAIIARDSAYQNVLIAARAEATDTGGLLEIKLPDGREERFRSPATLTALIDQMDARLSILRARLSGHQFVGSTYR